MKCSVRIFLLSTIHLSIHSNIRLLASEIAMISLITCLESKLSFVFYHWCHLPKSFSWSNFSAE